MKHLFKVLLYSLLLFSSTSIYCQETSTIKTPDEVAIDSAILGYITNFFLNDYEKMEVHLHDRLSKRGINEREQLSEGFSKEKLQALLKKNRPLPLEYQKNEITRVEVYGNTALAILKTGYPSVRWTEYIHLVKLNEKWIIMDVFWSFYADKK